MHVIKVNDLSKKFRIYHEKPALVNIWKKKRYEELWALKNINFKAAKGETIGIIGRNGSGKSTLLKILCGVMAPTSGSIGTNGRIASLLELGAGFHPELTGRENIFLNASIMNLSTKEVKNKFDDIVSFSQLEDFIDTPLYTYSSGMYVRLGFAIAVFTNFDILIIDEILAVGDAGFQEKCIDRIMEFKNAGKTIVFVTHDLGVAEKISDKILWLENGKLKKEKGKEYIIDSYLEMFSKETEEYILKKEHDEKNNLSSAETLREKEKKKIRKSSHGIKVSSQRWGWGDVDIIEISLYDKFKKETRVFQVNDEFIVSIKYMAHKKIINPVFGIAIHRTDGIHITGPNTKHSNYKIDFIQGSGTIEYKIPELPLLQGTYLLSAAIYNYSHTKPYDHHEKMYKFKVIRGACKETHGTIKIPCKWTLKGNK